MKESKGRLAEFSHMHLSQLRIMRYTLSGMRLALSTPACYFSLGTDASLVDTPYEQRGLPPDSIALNNYHVCRVLKAFDVLEGISASAFGQPGGGVQYKTLSDPDYGHIHSIIAAEYLEEITSSRDWFDSNDLPAPSPFKL